MGVSAGHVAHPISYRQLSEEMMEERGVEVDHSTLNRWVIKYAPRSVQKLVGSRGDCESKHLGGRWVQNRWTGSRNQASRCKTAQRTCSIRLAPRRDQRICCDLFIRRLTRKFASCLPSPQSQRACRRGIERRS